MNHCFARMRSKMLIALAAMLFACLAGCSSSEKGTVLKMAHALPTDHVFDALCFS